MAIQGNDPMINLRMIALALALLMIGPVALGAAEETSRMFEAAADAGHEVRDIIIANRSVNDTPVNASNTFLEEQLVEGHTVFITLTMIKRAAPKPREGNITVEGDVHCTGVGKVHTSDWLFGIMAPDRVNEAGAHCSVAGQVVWVPDPLDPDTWFQNFQASGNLQTFQTPTGKSTYAREFVGQVVVPDGDKLVAKQVYAWTTPVLAEPWIGADGKPKNVMMAFPLDRLQENGYDHYRAYWVAHDK